MNKFIYFLILFFIPSSLAFPKTIFCNLSLLANQNIKLEGFNVIKTYPILSTAIDEKRGLNGALVQGNPITR